MWRPRFVRRAAAVYEDIAEIADIAGDRRWWLLAGAAAVRWPTKGGGYLSSDAEPAGDTFIGFPSPPLDPRALAEAARQALRALDGTLPGQPLAVTVKRDVYGARTVASDLSAVAFVEGNQVRIEGDGVPFVAISVDDEPIETARHGHRRAWKNGRGPWLGIGRSGGLTIVSTCHMVVDGYGHAEIAEALARAHVETAFAPPHVETAFAPPHVETAFAPPHIDRPVVAVVSAAPADDAPVRLPAAGPGAVPAVATGAVPLAVPAVATGAVPLAVPAVATGAVPLAVHWRELAGPAPRLLELGYRLGVALHRLAGDPAATFSPTFQIPVAPGRPDDPQRLRRRVIPAIVSVRFSDGRPEPYEVFATRAKAILAREAAGNGLTSTLKAAAEAIPLPERYKRSQIGAERAGFWGNVANVLGGRVCLTKLRMDVPAVAVSSAAQLASERDPMGGSVITIVEGDGRAIVTICGTGTAADPALLDLVLTSGEHLD